jgi:type IV pilus assembly protein PilA
MNYSAPVPPKKSGFPVWLIVILIASPMIIGIFAILAIYGARKYIANSKTAEARNTLYELARDATYAYERDGKLCPSASAPIPTVVPRAAKYKVIQADWEADKHANAGFACLKFSMALPQYYQYDYKSTSTSFTITAHGDLNGDGIVSTFELDGQVVGGAVKVSMIRETNPEE